MEKITIYILRECTSGYIGNILVMLHHIISSTTSLKIPRGRFVWPDVPLFWPTVPLLPAIVPHHTANHIAACAQWKGARDRTRWRAAKGVSRRPWRRATAWVVTAVSIQAICQGDSPTYSYDDSTEWHPSFIGFHITKAQYTFFFIVALWNSTEDTVI